MTAVKFYFEDLARMKDLHFIDEHDFIERVYADMPPLFCRPKGRKRPMKTLMFFRIMFKALCVRFRGHR